MTNARTGKVERVYVDLNAVYPNDDDPNEELSFEELRAKSRGWLNRDWSSEPSKPPVCVTNEIEELQPVSSSIPRSRPETAASHGLTNIPFEPQQTEPRDDTVNESRPRETKAGRPKKKKVMEVKSETQTSTSTPYTTYCILTLDQSKRTWLLLLVLRYVGKALLSLR